MNNSSLWLCNASTDVGIFVLKLFNESNFLWTLTKRISLAHHHIVDGIFRTQLVWYGFFTFTHSLIQLSSTGREWLISLMLLYNTPQVRGRNICEDIFDVKRKTEEVESVKGIWYESPTGPRFSMRNQLVNVRSQSTHGANHLRNQITVAICSQGKFSFVQKIRKIRTRSAPDMLRHNWNQSPHSRSPHPHLPARGPLGRLWTFNSAWEVNAFLKFRWKPWSMTKWRFNARRKQ